MPEISEKTKEPFKVQDTLLEVKGLTKSFDDKPVLTGVNLELKRRDKLSVLGPGGSGKSTLLKMILGLIRPDSGAIQIMGENLSELSGRERQAVLRRVAMAFQLGGLFDFLNVRENILFAMENMTELSPSIMDERVVELLDAVKLPHAAGKLPSELSGGMRRRVGIVRAMATSPELGLFDEPTAGLDPVTTTVVIDMIHKIAEKLGTACLCVTSSVEVAFTFSKQVSVLRDGTIIGQGTWQELRALDDPWLDHFLSVRQFQPPEASL